MRYLLIGLALMGMIVVAPVANADVCAPPRRTAAVEHASAADQPIEHAQTLGGRAEAV